MGILDILLGGGARGKSGAGSGDMTKIGMALISYMLWRWYQNSQGGGAQPAPMPSPGNQIPQQPPSRLPHGDPLDIPAPRSGSADDNDFGPLVESTRRMPPSRGGRGPMADDDEAGGGDMGGMGGGGMGGSLGDILNDILAGGRGMPGGESGGGRSRGGRGGSLEDILGGILGGQGGGFPGSRVAGPQGDPFGSLPQGPGPGGLGALISGGAAGGMLGDLLQQFDRTGAGDAARSWVSQDENMPVTPQQVESSFGPDVINQLADQFGLDKNALLQGLSEAVPDVVNQLTPDGRLPTEDELTRRR